MAEDQVSKMNHLKCMHISFDDVYRCLYEITIHPYESIFENEFFRELEGFHRQYGAVFTLNCFNTCSKEPSYEIGKLPERYRKELADCSGWLKFAFHGEDDTSNYGTGKNGTSTGGNPTGDCVQEVRRSYERFLSAILKAAGTDRTIDRVVRLGFFGGTLENVKALRSGSCGILGLLTADDERISYYLSPEENQKLLGTYEYYDQENRLLLLRSQVRLEGAADPLQEMDKMAGIPSGMLEVFTHEQNYDESVKKKLEAYLCRAKERGYSFDFAQNQLIESDSVCR